jgi:hypothetical protein
MVTAIMIIEMMGRPKEHLQGALVEHISKLESTKGITMIKKMFSEPRLLDEKTGLYTIFSEVEFNCSNLLDLMNIIFDFMPASIEVVDPATLNLSSEEATLVMNALTGRLHKYDEVAKIMKNRENQLFQELNLSKKLLFAHKIINKEGKIIKMPQGNEMTNEENKKEDNNKHKDKSNEMKKNKDNVKHHDKNKENNKKIKDSNNKKIKDSNNKKKVKKK